MMFPCAPNLSKPHENFRSKKFECSDRKQTPSKNNYSTSFSQETPPMIQKRIGRTFLTDQRLDPRRRIQDEITPIKSVQIAPRKGSLQSFEKILSSIDFVSGSKVNGREIPLPHMPKESLCFVRRSAKKDAGIRSEEKATGLSSTLDTSNEDSKINSKLQCSHYKEPRLPEPRSEISSFEVDGFEVPFRRRRFASVDLVLKKRKVSRSRRENDKTKNYQVLSLNRIIQEDSEEGSTQRGGRDRDIDDFVTGNDDTEKEWRFVLSGSDRDAKVREEYENEMKNIDREIVEFIRMGIARKGLLMNKLKFQNRTVDKTMSDELTRMKMFIDNAVSSYYDSNSNVSNTP